MQVVHERCCGLDVHKRVIVACVLTRRERTIRSFGTMSEDLEAMAVWLEECAVTHVAMESTGVFWKPIYNVLEEHEFELLVVNAQHMKAIPGKKTDVKDAEWIADLLRHGLLKPSFVPSRAQRELRELVRYRKSLVRERSAESNRIQKVLEGANVKLGSVATVGWRTHVNTEVHLSLFVRGRTPSCLRGPQTVASNGPAGIHIRRTAASDVLPDRRRVGR